MWDINKINDYIANEIEENLQLDYKAAGALGKTEGKKKEISKDVSAFANSAGGIIIYGISEFDEAKKSHLPEKIDPVNRTEFSKEWIEQVINSNISPKVSGIKIFPIQVGAAADNHGVYIIEIPQSNTAHQAKDKKYYKRYNFESVAMEDYELKDIINRTNKTDIRISFEPDIGENLYSKFIEEGKSFDIGTKIWANNIGNQVTQFLEVYITGDGEVANFILEPLIENGKDFELNFSNGKERKITVNEDDFIIGTERIPILPKTSRMVGKIKFHSKLILNDMEISIQISTEDGSKFIKLKGKEIMQEKEK